MGSNEDCASVLEQFIHDAANLPAEVSHMMEEIQAKDTEMQKSLSLINARDAGLQKQVKLQGSLIAHPKESEYSDVIRKHYVLATELQSQKVTLSEKACHLLERQIKRLDVKIRDLQNDGQLLEGLPSVFNRKPPEPQKTFADLPLAGNSALQVVTSNALNMNMAATTHRITHQVNPQLAQAVARQVSLAATNVSAVRSSAPATPSSSLAQHQRHRESSAGATDNKRRKLNGTSFTANLPAQPSSLRQSSLGPGAATSATPKPGTPTGTSASVARSGSLPRTTGSQQGATTVKKSGLSKHVAPHQQVSKLKGKALTKQARLSISASGRKKGASPSVRSRVGADDDNDSILSSADASDTDSHVAQQHKQHRGRRSKKDKVAQASAQASVSDHEDLEEEDDQEDDRRYCFCNERSYGEMVACENEKCTYEWFHLACIGLKKPPEEEEVWYCPACRKDFVKDEKKGK